VRSPARGFDHRHEQDVAHLDDILATPLYQRTCRKYMDWICNVDSIVLLVRVRGFSENGSNGLCLRGSDAWFTTFHSQWEWVALVGRVACLCWDPFLRVLGGVSKGV